MDYKTFVIVPILQIDIQQEGCLASFHLFYSSLLHEISQGQLGFSSKKAEMFICLYVCTKPLYNGEFEKPLGAS